MDQEMLTKQMNGFYKNVVNSSMNAITMFQEQTEKMVSNSLVQSPWIPEEGKKFVMDWLKSCRKGSNEFIAATSGQYEKFGTFFNLNKRDDSTEASSKGKSAKGN